MSSALEASAARTPRRGLATEIWLLRRCRADERSPEEIARSFALAPPALVFAEHASGPGLDAVLAAAWQARLVRSAELAPRAPSETLAALADRAWPVLERALSEHGPARLLFVLELEVLLALVSRALSIPPTHFDALCVDPGRLVLLRDDPIGFVLRRSNVRAPESVSGTALPSAHHTPGEAGARERSPREVEPGGERG